MEHILSSLASLATAAGGKVLLALVVLLVGNVLIKKLLKLLSGSHLFDRVEGAVRTFTLSFIKISLYVLLIISIISILGVPMASVVAVLASASVTVGLALQGALSNLAGGIMLMIFKPFNLGDYVSAAGVDGTVKEVTLFYTVLVTPDNKRITVPNGSQMNATVTDYSSEPTRRVDLTFSCARTESPAKIQELMQAVIATQPEVAADPAPFARVSGGTNEAMQFTVRVWCKNEDYWTVYFDLTQKITEAMAAHNVQAPAMRITANGTK